jgi:hypothetical protein
MAALFFIVPDLFLLIHLCYVVGTRFVDSFRLISLISGLLSYISSKCRLPPLLLLEFSEKNNQLALEIIINRLLFSQ